MFSDMQEFGERNRRQSFDARRCELVVQNFAHAGSLVRRAAIEAAGPFDDGQECPQSAHADWFTWRHIIEQGWRAAKSEAVYEYRQHGRSQIDGFNADRRTYYELAALDRETLTLFIPLSGRRWAWPRMREFLENQTWPHDQIRLVFCDTSDDELFSIELRDWLSRCDYADCRHYWQNVGRSGLADENRSAVAAEVQSVMPRIYNRLAREATTEYVWIVEDDVIPPLDSAANLLRSMDANIASVSAAYLSRHKPEFVAWDHNGRPFASDAEFDSEVTAVGGNGFGCVILRRSALRQTVLQHATPTRDYDPNFYHWLASTGRWRALLDWSICGDHLDAPCPGNGKLF